METTSPRQWQNETQTHSTLPQKPCTNSELSRKWTYQSFSDKFAADLQAKYCQPQNTERCITGSAPTLAEVNKAYPEISGGAALEWLVPQIADIVVFSGAKEKINERQYRQIAALIATRYPWLKVTDIMLFCWRFKAGTYGRFYGSVDPMMLMTALETYTTERAVIIQRAEQRKRDEANERHKKTAIPCPEAVRKSILGLFARANQQNKETEKAKIEHSGVSRDEPNNCPPKEQNAVSVHETRQKSNF